MPTNSNAQSLVVEQISSSTFRFTPPSGSLSSTVGAPIYMKMWEGQNPATSTRWWGNDFTTNYNFSLATYIPDASGFTCSVDTVLYSYFDCNVQSFTTGGPGGINSIVGEEYWFQIYSEGADIDYQWFYFRKNTDSWEYSVFPSFPDSLGFNSVTNTRFTDLSVTGTSTIVINAEYFLDLSEIDTTVNEFNPTQVAFRTSLRPSSTFSSVSESIDNTISGTSTASTTLIGLVDGVYDLNITFANNGTLFGNPRPFEKSYIYTEFTISSGTLQSVGALEFYDGRTPPNPQSYQPCGITNLSGCLINAGMYMVYPSTESLEQFSEIYTTMSGKFPFAYFTDFNDSIMSVFTASTTHSLALEVPFGNFGTTTLISAEMIESFPLTGTIRTILGAIIWLMLGATIYRRTYRIFNQQSV